MDEKLLIVPTSDIVFAVKKDGSYIANFSQGGGIAESNMMLFGALAKYAKECPEKELTAFALSHALLNRMVGDAIIIRMEKLAAQE